MPSIATSTTAVSNITVPRSDFLILAIARLIFCKNGLRDEAVIASSLRPQFQ
jgi:hypothetical protein